MYYIGPRSRKIKKVKTWTPQCAGHTGGRADRTDERADGTHGRADGTNGRAGHNGRASGP